MSKKLSKLRIDALAAIEPKTASQKTAFDEWASGQNLILHGSAGTGKSFIALAMAFREILDPKSEYDNVMIIRSVVPTRDMGFMPGDEEEKIGYYARPYVDLSQELLGDNLAWEKLTAHGQVDFECTSFIRGQTWNRTIVVVDEMQNMTEHELDSIITRLGEQARIIFCGDYSQSDFTKLNDKKGLQSFLNVIQSMHKFTKVSFGWEDIVRSGIVREYIIAKERQMMEQKNG